MKLNPAQEEVASHVHGRILTLAGPGSGKTRTLTERTARLIRTGASPASILCITFTNKARDEMRERIAKACGPAAEKVFISNFHGLCGMILRRLGSPMGYSDRLTILDTDDQVELIAQIARKRGLELTRPAARGIAWITNSWRENLGDADELHRLAKNKLRESEIRIVRLYVETLRQRNQTDFSGLLSEAAFLLREHEDIRARLQKKFRFIQVDEFQDTNRAQHEIVELIANAEDNVLAVGDGDQSIYEWRGASPDGIKRFIENGQKKTGNCRIVKLGTNYRSTPQIVGVADKLIRHCHSRIAVEFSTIHADGEAVKCAKLPTPDDEAGAIAASIENLLRQQVPAKEIAIFYRTNDMSRPIEQALARKRIPYQVIGSGSYYDRMEVKDVLAMLRFVCNPRDGISFARIANKPARGMGDALIGRLESYAETHRLDLLTVMDDGHLSRIRGENDKPLGESALRACRGAREIFAVPAQGHSVSAIAHELLSRTHYDQWLQDKYEDKQQLQERRQNINELVNSIALFSRSEPRAGVADYLQSISLYTDDDQEKTDNAVRMMSLHASKGLEFDVVFIAGLEQGILPHEKAVADRGDFGFEEERRLCYVGFTRARKILRVTWCEKRQDSMSRNRSARFRTSLPSKFLFESGLMSEQDYDHALKTALGRR